MLLMAFPIPPARSMWLSFNMIASYRANLVVEPTANQDTSTFPAAAEVGGGFSVSIIWAVVP